MIQYSFVFDYWIIWITLSVIFFSANLNLEKMKKDFFYLVLLYTLVLISDGNSRRSKKRKCAPMSELPCKISTMLYPVLHPDPTLKKYMTEHTNTIFKTCEKNGEWLCGRKKSITYPWLANFNIQKDEKSQKTKKMMINTFERSKKKKKNNS